MHWYKDNPGFKEVPPPPYRLSNKVDTDTPTHQGGNMASLTQDGSKRNGIAKNRGGRPKGAKNKSTILAEAIRGDFDKSLKSNFKAIMSVLIAKAKDGDMQAIKLLFDKAVPNAVDGKEDKVKDFGINIIISDMTPKQIECETLEGEVVNE